MRHKLLHFIEMILANDSVGDVAEIDEKYILASHKGTNLEGDDPRKHGSIAPKPGITRYSSIYYDRSILRQKCIYSHL